MGEETGREAFIAIEVVLEFTTSLWSHTYEFSVQRQSRRYLHVIDFHFDLIKGAGVVWIGVDCDRDPKIDKGSATDFG